MAQTLIGLTTVDDNELTAETRAVLAAGPEVIAQWKAVTAEELRKASELQAPILENTLPSFHDTLALLLTPACAERAGIDIAVLAAEHGGERARLTRYDTMTLIHELQLFRRVLFDVLGTRDVTLAPAQSNAMHACIDGAIRASANAFAGVQAALREQFAAALAHDLRTPLANAHLAAELIERSSSLAQAQGLARRILQNTSRIEQMTREMLDNLLFVGSEGLPLRITQFDMSALAVEVVEHTATFHGTDVHLKAQPVTGFWCRGSIQRAIENLISNAIKYGDQDGGVQLWVESSALRVTISVHNDGPPIPVEDTESLFQLYHRAEEARDKAPGWGVGLPFVRRVAEGHGGSVMVSSTAEDGTTFVIDLPLDARPYQRAPSVA